MIFVYGHSSSTDDSTDQPVTTGSDQPVTIGSDQPVTTKNDLPVTTGSDQPVTTKNDQPVTTERGRKRRRLEKGRTKRRKRSVSSKLGKTLTHYKLHCIAIMGTFNALDLRLALTRVFCHGSVCCIRVFHLCVTALLKYSVYRFFLTASSKTGLFLLYYVHSKMQIKVFFSFPDR